MKKYKVLSEVEIDGAVKAVDEVVELSEEVAAPLIAEGKIEIVAEETAPEGEQAAA